MLEDLWKKLEVAELSEMCIFSVESSHSIRLFKVEDGVFQSIAIKGQEYNLRNELNFYLQKEKHRCAKK